MRAKDLFACIREPLDEVERRLASQAEAIVAAWRPVGVHRRYLELTVRHLLRNPGKLLRPALVLLSAGLATGRPPPRLRRVLVPLATTVELIHAASLVHDDIIDEDKTRRGKPSVNSRFGNHAAVLVGDMLYSQSFSLLTHLKLPRWDQQRELFRIFCDTTRAMCMGEMIEQRMLSRGRAQRRQIDRAEYLEVLRDKTAVLMSACCRSAGVACGAPKRQTGMLASFGLSFGLAFQLFDDLADKDALAGPAVDVLAEARGFLAQALAVLDNFPDSPYRRELLRACSSVART